MASSSMIGADRKQNPKMPMGKNYTAPAGVKGVKQNPAQHSPNVRTMKPHSRVMGK